MLIYLLKSSACLAIFQLFYKLFLENEDMHIFKRFYLLCAALASLIIPLVIFTEYVEVEAISQSTIRTLRKLPFESTATPETSADYLSSIFWGLYAIGALTFGYYFLKNLFEIMNRIQKNPKLKTKNSIKVLLCEPTIPHTFFNYIFLNQQKFEAKEIPDAVLLHEETHARQKHSIDVFLVEFLQVLLWFNPFIIGLKKAIKLNHEFLADQAVVTTGIPTNTYQSLILAYSSNAFSPKLANAINYSSYSSIKKRISVMKTKTSKKSIAIRSLFALSLTALLLYGFSENKLVEVQKKNTYSNQSNSPSKTEKILETSLISENQKGATQAQIEEYNALSKKYNAVPIEKRIIPLKDLKVLETIYREMTLKQRQESLPFPECPVSSNQEPATKKQLTEYNTLAKKYNAMIQNGKIWIEESEVNRMTSIYNLMTDAQKEKAEPYPNFPPPPPAPVPPSALNERVEATRAINKIIEEQDPYDVVGGPINVTRSTIPEPTPSISVAPVSPNIKNGQINLVVPPPAPSYMNDPEANIPPAPEPPEPISPLDHVIEMAKKGAPFYYEGKEISSDKAIDILKNNKNINIDSRSTKGEKPIVKLSTEPITIVN